MSKQLDDALAWLADLETRIDLIEHRQNEMERSHPQVRPAVIKPDTTLDHYNLIRIKRNSGLRNTKVRLLKQALRF